jgi:hypothetical protein
MLIFGVVVPLQMHRQQKGCREMGGEGQEGRRGRPRRSLRASRLVKSEGIELVVVGASIDHAIGYRK